MGCGESKHAVSTQDSTISKSKRSNSKKNVVNNGDGLKVVKDDHQNVKDGGGDDDKKEISPVSVVENGDGIVKEDEKVVLQKQIDQSKEESMVENVKEAEDKGALPSASASAPVAVADGKSEKVDQIVVLEKQIDQSKEESMVKEAEKVDQIVLEKQIDKSKEESMVKEAAEKVDQIVLEKQIEQTKQESMVETVKEAEDKGASPSVPVADGKSEKVDQVVLEKQIDQTKQESMVETVKEVEEKEASPPSPSPSDAAAGKAAAVAVHSEAKGAKEKKGLEGDNPADSKTDASGEIKASGSEVKEPTKVIEIGTNQEAKKDKVLEDQKEPAIETGNAAESVEAKNTVQKDADEKIPSAKGEIEVESAAEALKKAD